MGSLDPNSKSKGFTLIEIIVILAVISILVAILTPTVLKYIDEARADRAQSDVNNISSMLNDLIRDTGQYPGALADASFLCGPGNLATGGSWATARTGTAGTSCTATGKAGVLADSLSNHLNVNDPNESGTANSTDDYRSTSGAKFRWKGPYITNISEDPWGNAYEVNVSTLTAGSTSVTWVISAGPDGTFQTSTGVSTLSGDDIGVRIK